MRASLRADLICWCRALARIPRPWLSAAGALLAAGLSTAALSSATPPPVPAAPPAAPSAPSATPQSGEQLFQAHCASCHEPATGRAPARAQLAAIAPFEIFNVLRNGAMRPMAQGLSDKELIALATWLSPPPKTPAAAAPPPGDPPPCPASTARFGMGGPGWNGWGNDPRNRRYQAQPGLSPADLPRLKVKWAFALDGGKYGQPTVVGGRVFLTSAGGKAYALDARTGCMHWRLDRVPARSTISVGALPGVSPSGYAAFFGDMAGTIHAVDAADGKPLWTVKVETHPFVILTGAPALYRGRLYVPLSSYEELLAFQAQYHCCTFRGGVVALDAASGKIVWKTPIIDQAPAPSHPNGAGTQMFGPAGAAIWSAPTIDAKRGLLYVGTGDSYTDVKENGSDAVAAIDLATGKVRWKTQVTQADNYLAGCEAAPPPVNCPKPVGHDWDFGASPILLTLTGGKDIILAGQKSGEVFGLDPDHGGAIAWRTKVGEGGPLGGVEFGMAADGRRLYVANADTFMPSPPGRPGLYALDPASGKPLWSAPSPILHCGWTGGALCLNGVSAAPTAIPGVVFAGDMNGRLRAYGSSDGKKLWEVDTGAGTWRTINGVAAQPGGNIDGPGPTIAGGMLYLYSGYLGSLGGAGTNVLLAWSVDGR